MAVPTASSLSAPIARLLVGIFSWPSRGCLLRRTQIRRAVQTGQHASYLFIMPAGMGHNDSTHGDFFKFALHDTPRERRKTAKFFLTNACAPRSHSA